MKTIIYRRTWMVFWIIGIIWRTNWKKMGNFNFGRFHMLTKQFLLKGWTSCEKFCLWTVLGNNKPILWAYFLAFGIKWVYILILYIYFNNRTPNINNMINRLFYSSNIWWYPCSPWVFCVDVFKYFCTDLGIIWK